MNCCVRLWVLLSYGQDRGLSLANSTPLVCCYNAMNARSIRAKFTIFSPSTEYDTESNGKGFCRMTVVENLHHMLLAVLLSCYSMLEVRDLHWHFARGASQLQACALL